MQQYERILKEYFSSLEFEEERHIYTVKGQIYPSVSHLIKQVSPTFHEDIVAERCSKKYSRPKKEILEEWKETRDEACDRGTRVHNFAEDYSFDRTLGPSCPQERAAKKFWDEMPEFIVPVCAELQMYHKLFHYAGTTDIVLFDKRDNTFILGDYKTNKDLFKNYAGQTLDFPFNDMLATPFSKYTLQLSYYQLMFKQTGYPVSKRKLVYLDLRGEYHIYDLEDVEHLLSQQLLKRN